MYKMFPDYDLHYYVCLYDYYVFVFFFVSFPSARIYKCIHPSMLYTDKLIFF